MDGRLIVYLEEKSNTVKFFYQNTIFEPIREDLNSGAEKKEDKGIKTDFGYNPYANIHLGIEANQAMMNQ